MRDIWAEVGKLVGRRRAAEAHPARTSGQGALVARLREMNDELRTAIEGVITVLEPVDSRSTKVELYGLILGVREYLSTVQGKMDEAVKEIEKEVGR